MAGNVYVKYFERGAANAAVTELKDIWYSGRKVKCELCPYA